MAKLHLLYRTMNLLAVRQNSLRVFSQWGNLQNGWFPSVARMCMHAPVTDQPPSSICVGPFAPQHKMSRQPNHANQQPDQTTRAKPHQATNPSQMIPLPRLASRRTAAPWVALALWADTWHLTAGQCRLSSIKHDTTLGVHSLFAGSTAQKSKRGNIGM